MNEYIITLRIKLEESKDIKWLIPSIQDGFEFSIEEDVEIIEVKKNENN
tara:strand:- start:8729 stop:8875 length:147 start_codon:yes stop_codon:yes gene_type:complete